MKASYIILALCLLGLASATANAQIPPPYSVGLDYECVSGQMQIQISIGLDYYNPGLPSDFTVIRRTTAPGLADPVAITSDPILMPPEGEFITVSLSDADLDPEHIGFYEIWAHWPDGQVELEGESSFSCTEHPYLMRGYLTDMTMVQPCEGIGLLECVNINLDDPNWWIYIDTGELLDFYGWPVWLNSASDCGIYVTRIEPLGPDAECIAPVATKPSSWSAVKSYYD